MRARRSVVRGALLTLLALLAGLLVALPAQAAAPPAAPARITLTAGASSVTVGWRLPAASSPPVTGVVVSRSGIAVDGSASGTSTVAPRPAQLLLDGLVPGARYTVSVAFVDADGTGPTRQATATLSSAGLPSAVDVTFGIDPAPVLPQRSYDDSYCSQYHFFNQQCGDFAVTMRTTGYDDTTTDAWWSLTAKVTRSFGCVRHGTTTYRPYATIARRFTTFQYGYWDYEPVAVGPDGSSTNALPHDFENPQSFAPADDMPHFVCPAGWDVAQANGTVSDAVAVLHAGGVESAGPVLGVLYLPGSGTASTGLG